MIHQSNAPFLPVPVPPPADTAAAPKPNSTLIALAVSLALCTQVSCPPPDNPDCFDIDRENLASALTQSPRPRVIGRFSSLSDIVAAKSCNRIKGELEPKQRFASCFKEPALHIGDGRQHHFS